VIVASGPSAKDADLELVRGRAKVIVINSSWRLAPWADVLYACDCKWWNANKEAFAFAGLKITQSENCSDRLHTVRVLSGAQISTDRGRIGGGGNSGFQACNLAVQFGARPLVLVGFDMRLDLGVHWHGAHGPGLNNPNEERVKRWRQYLDQAAPAFARLGVRVINASPVSALRAYPKMNLAEALTKEGVSHA
jgi:hypothetical protein